MGRLVLIDSDIPNEAVNALPDVLGTSNFKLRLQLNHFATSRYEPLTQIAEALQQHGFTLIRSSKGFRVEKFCEIKAQGLSIHLGEHGL